MKILAILQARVSSTRLPEKVLKPILGKPLIQLQLERMQRSRKIDKFIVATSNEGSDHALQKLCELLNIECYRGSLNDVLDRFYQAALLYKPEHVVRITGDCPLIDPTLVDHVINYYLEGGYDYASNAFEPTFPDGLDVEIFRFDALQQAWEEAKLPSEHEHVTPFINKQPERFRIGSFKGDVDHSNLRWTVDEPEDFEFVRIIYETLYPKNPNFTTDDVLTLLDEKPELKKINSGLERNEGLEKTLQEDKKHMAKNSCPKSISLQERAQKRIPGMTQLLSKHPDQFSQGVWPGYFSKASGVDVWDLDGNRYIDMSIGGIGANVLGYADPDVDVAVIEAVKAGNSSSLNCPEEVELADLLCDIHPWAEKVRYARTGGESMAIAVRIARAFTGKDKVAFCGYHGWHDWYLAANIGDESRLNVHLMDGLSATGVPRGLKGTAIPFRYNRIEELEEIVAKNRGELAAIVMEPIRNDKPAPGFFDAVKRLARKADAVLIIDEISSGFRMNSGGAHLLLGVEPDIAVFSKALGNGYPIGAVIGKAEVMDAVQKTFISSTYWTEKIGPVAAIATIRKHRHVDAGKHLMKIGTLVQNAWQQVAGEYELPIVVSGIPPLSHFEFQGSNGHVLKALFVQLMLQRGYLASTSFYSMYAHTEKHVKAYEGYVQEVFKTLARAERRGDARSMLIGLPAKFGFKRYN